MYEADFTTEAASPVKCGRCAKEFPPGTKLAYMHSKSATEAGRHLCDDCYQHYRSKASTHLSARPGNNNNSNHHESVRQHIAAAQRGERTHPVVPVGSTSGNANAAPSGRQYTHINVASPANASAFTMSFPVSKKTPLFNVGYQEAHLRYKELCDYYRSKAYSTSQYNELIVVKFHMMTLAPNKMKPQLISNLTEAIGDIPVHVGAVELKYIGFHAILPHFVKWSAGFPLKYENCELRTKLWVELTPKTPDVDAISDKFFDYRGRNKTGPKYFSAKQGTELYIAIQYELLEEILDHQTRRDGTVPRSSLTRKIDNLIVGRSRGINTVALAYTASKRKKVDNDKISDEEDKGTSKRVQRSNHAESHERRSALVLPPPEEMHRALSFQVPPRRRNMKQLFDQTSIDLKFYMLPQITLSALLKNPRAFLEPEHFPVTPLTLTYSPSATQKFGSFKIAAFGHTSAPLFGRSTRVCFKQCYDTKPGTGARIIYKGAEQATRLTVELNCLGWASALTQYVYDFIDDFIDESGAPPLAIPRMRYVESGLAVAVNAQSGLVYLLEEIINTEEATGDWFVKYINNSSPTPMPFLDKQKVNRADFLSFAQHVQFWKTGGKVFVSDYQGGREMLTDPQIISHPELGHLFADGNTNFNQFIQHHECNEFCKYFDIPTVTKISESLGLASLPPNDNGSPDLNAYITISE